MDKDSLNIKQKNLDALQKQFPNIFSESRIDLEKFKAVFCDDIDFGNERYTLNWAGKADAFRILHEGKLTDNVENKGNFFYINNELVIALTKMDLEIATEIIGLQPQKVIALDRLFAGNDELKTNTALQMRDAGVEFRVV